MTRYYLISVSFFDKQQALFRGSNMTTFAATGGIPLLKHIEDVVRELKHQWCVDCNYNPDIIYHQVNCCDFLGES